MVHSATLEEPFGDFLYSYTRSVRSSNLILGIYPKEIKSHKKIVFIRFIHLHFTKIVFNSFEKK